MSNESDLTVECNAVSEYGQAMAMVATSLMRYPDRMHQARSESERDFLRSEHERLVRKIVKLHSLAIDALEHKHRKERTMNIKEWLIVLSAGAAPAGAMLAAAPITVPVVIGAVVAFLAGAGGAAKTLHMPSPNDRKNPNGSAVDNEDPR